VILMPLEAANVIGAIGGIAELAKSALGQQQGGQQQGGQTGGPWNSRPQA
jgi:hypothetical protein